MKKLMLVSAFALCVIGAKAQTVELIPKAGINIARQSISGIDGEKGKVGFQGGLGVNFQMANSNFSIQPELNFVSKGTKIKSGQLKSDLNVSYLELPLLAKYTFGPVYVNAGPSLGLRLGQNKVSEASYGELKRLDFGVQMGAGISVPLGLGKIILDGRYALGLSDVSDIAATKIKNKGVMISAGYAIPF